MFELSEIDETLECFRPCSYSFGRRVSQPLCGPIEFKLSQHCTKFHDAVSCKHDSDMCRAKCPESSSFEGWASNFFCDYNQIIAPAIICQGTCAVGSPKVRRAYLDRLDRSLHMILRQDIDQLFGYLGN